LNNNNLEKDILSSMIMDKQACSVGLMQLTENDFGPYKHIFKAMRELRDENKEVDVTLITQKGVPLQHLAALMDSRTTSAYVQSYISQLKDNLYKDSCKKYTNDLNYAIDNLTVGEIQDRLVDIPNYDSKANNFKHTGDLFREVFTDMMARADLMDDISGLRTGIDPLDEITDGMKKTEVIFIEAGTNVGKTMLMLNIAYNIAKTGKRVDWFGYEMPSRQIAKRLVPMDYNIDFKGINRPKTLSERDIGIINQKANQESFTDHINIFGTDSLHYRTINEIKFKVNDLNTKLKNKPSCICVDYLRLLAGLGDDRNQIMANNLNLMMDYAAELDIPIITVIGQNKSEQTSGLNDMTYDVHQHWLLRYIEKEDAYKLTVVKNRDGMKGEILLDFARKYNTFRGI